MEMWLMFICGANTALFLVAAVTGHWAQALVSLALAGVSLALAFEKRRYHGRG